MANLNEAAIRTAIAEVLDGTRTTAPRELVVGLASGDLAPGASNETAAQRAATLPRFTTAIAYTASPDAVQGPGPQWLQGIEVTITTTYLLSTPALLRVDYDAVRNSSAVLGHLMRVAFAWPGTLTTTTAAVATGIVGGVLKWQGSNVTADTVPAPGATGGGLYETEHRFTGTVQITIPVA